MWKKVSICGLVLALMVSLLAGTASAVGTTYVLPKPESCLQGGVITDRRGYAITRLPVAIQELGGQTWIREVNSRGEVTILPDKEYRVMVNLNYLFGRNGKRAGDPVDVEVNVIYDGYLRARGSGKFLVEMTDRTTGWRYLAQLGVVQDGTETMPICVQAGVSGYSLSREPVLCTLGQNYLEFSFYTGNNPKQAPPTRTKLGEFMSGYGRMDLQFLTVPRAQAEKVGFEL